MIKKSIGLLIAVMVFGQSFGQLNLSEQLKKVMHNYENLEHYQIEIYTETHFDADQAKPKRQLAGRVIKKGENYYVKNDQKEVYQYNGKRVEVDNVTKHVIYYPVAEKHASFWKSYEPDWKTIEEKSAQIIVSKKNGKTTYKIPVNEFQIESIEYVIDNSKDLIDELVYHYKTEGNGEADWIRVTYSNNLKDQPSKAVFSFAKVVNTGKSGNITLTEQYKDFEFINTSSYETQH